MKDKPIICIVGADLETENVKAILHALADIETKTLVIIGYDDIVQQDPVDELIEGLEICMKEIEPFTYEENYIDQPKIKHKKPQNIKHNFNNNAFKNRKKTIFRNKRF